jgi:hypothetical protein
MAYIVPDVLPKSASAGERRLHAVLRRLPEDCVVYYEPMVGDRCPDFVVISPELGLLVIEVKGWRSGDILAADDRTVQVAQQGRPVRQVHPLRQAREYMFALMDRCRAHPAIGPLLQPEGFHENRFLFPFGYFALLSNITEAQLKNHPGGDLTAIFPKHRVMPRDALIELEGQQSAVDLHEALRPCFVKSWSFPRLSEVQVDALRAIIHPEIILELPLEYAPKPRPEENPESRVMTARVQETPPMPARTFQPESRRAAASAPPASTLKVLDLRQENHARAIGDGHRILSGVAGSGKTLVLLARAKLLAQRDPATRVLVLCFNVTLASFLRGQLQEHINVSVCHLEGWAAANRVRRDLQAQESDESLGNRLLTVLKEADGLGDLRRFDAVLVDEAQDFEVSWFRCVLAAMKDPSGGDLLIVGDGNQGVYRRGKVSWKSLGIQAIGRTISGRFGLDINYRNSSEIAALAQVFANGATDQRGQADEDTIGALPLDLTKCPRATGWKPVLCREETRKKECERAVTLVEDLLAGRWNGERLPEPLRPEQIGILYRRIAKAEQPLFARFLADLQTVAPVRWLNSKNDLKARTRVLEPGMKVQTIHASKGLQYRAVILLWAGDMPYVPPESRHDELAERRLFYVGLTRAEDFLALTAPASAARSHYLHIVEASQLVIAPVALRSSSRSSM